MLINQLKNIYLKYYSTLMYLKLADQFDELFLFLESFKQFSFICDKTCATNLVLRNKNDQENQKY